MLSDGDGKGRLGVGAGRVGVTYGLGFESHEKHMHKESRS